MLKFGKMLNRARRLYRAALKQDTKLEEIKSLLAKSLIRNIRQDGQVADISHAEFKVTSQFGEDGIIQYLIQQTRITNAEQSFIEFGVEDYTEANTRFLLTNNNWRGCILDGSKRNIAAIQASDLGSGPIKYLAGMAVG